MPDRYVSVDMDRLEVRREVVPTACLGTGGRGFVAAWLDAAVEPTLDPLGPDNPFIIANGLLAGSGAPCSGRVSVGCKSPLTGTIKEANAGGGAGLALARQLAEGSTPLGREMALGTERFGRLHGVRRLPVVKGQAMAGYDPRAAKGTGVTYATSGMGADHTAGNTMGNRSVSPLRKEGQIKASREAQRLVAVFDSLGMCLFSSIPASDPAVFALVGDMLAGLDGGDWPPARVEELGKSCLARERHFNARAGITPDMDDIPAFMREEPLAPHQTVFDIDRDELQGVRDDD